MFGFAIYKQLVSNKGIKYVLFRTLYEIGRKIGLLKIKYPTHVRQYNWISLAKWREMDLPFSLFLYNSVNINDKTLSCLKEKMELITNGSIQFFNNQFINIGLDYDWVTNPESTYKYDISKHWTEIEDIDKNTGDIKYVWEKSRFSFLYTIIRYDTYLKGDHSQFVISQILDWIKKNPLNCGPNFKCSQEISLRVINWMFALNYYKKSSFLSEDIFQTIMNSIYWQVKHVYENINFSRIAVRNNHAITETLTLYIFGLLCPFFNEAQIWKQKGKMWFEKEVKYQIDDDGTFIQNSMNYQRVVVQLLSLAISITDYYNEKFSDIIYEKAYKSLNFLYQCQDPYTGELPNYGANDGALFFPLNDYDFRDYRPQLDALHQLLTGKNLYSQKYEDSYWLCRDMIPEYRKRYKPIIREEGIISFTNSGYFLIREFDTLTFIRCGLFKGIPGHADNFHIDIWHNGKNVLMDGGSYKYNTDDSTIKYFSGTESHNSVMIDNNDQMLKGPRFIWLFWPKKIAAKLYLEGDYFIFKGSVNCFRQVSPNIFHERVIKKKIGVGEWLVEDKLSNMPKNSQIRQLWHYLDGDAVKISSKSSTVMNIDTNSYNSVYYGCKNIVKQRCFITTDNTITTSIII